jgi:hypothetical protein
MTSKLTPQIAFPPGIPIPEKLQALVDAVNAGTFEPDDFGDFGLDFEPVTEKAIWFASPVTSSALYAAEQLASFGRGPDGSSYAIWKAPTGGFPVVYLDSEGDSYALATDFDQFLRLAVAGDEEEDEERNPDFLDWVRDQGLTVPESRDDVTDAAGIAYPDFPGWCEEAAEGTLSAETAISAHIVGADPKPVSAIPANADLWALMVAAIGQRIDSPAVQTLLEKIGAKPLAPATPRNDSSHTGAKSLGIEISASCDLKHRAYWPTQKEGRIWVTYVTRIMIEPPYSGPLPQGLDWAMSQEALDTAGIKTVRGALKTAYWTLPAPRDGIEIEATTSKNRAFARLWLKLPEEKDHITASTKYEKEKPLAYVEAAFFASWCALKGLLRADKFTPDLIEPLRERRMTPLQFLHGPCGQLLWSGDIAPDARGFVSDYFDGVLTPDAQRWVTDVKTVFGSSNHFRDADEAMTEDTWDNFDRIAPVIEKRYGEWRRGELKAKWD